MTTHPGLAALQPLIFALLAGGWAVHARRLYRQLHRIRRDPLTGLLTRDGWSRTAERVIARNRRAVVVLGDLNGFKPVNDSYGHDAGDAVLAAVGQRLTDWCGGHDVAGRLGGDEFVAVLRDDQDLQQRLAELAHLVREPVVHRGVTLRVGISLGSGRTADLEDPTLAAALKAADTAMYLAKGRGHGRRGGLLAPALAAASRRLVAQLAGRFRLAA
ncbi:GGDEF domain-containing protein [Streptomyces sp. RLB3-6]|uniref:GGDEF domain-containing protein n=1 Tax=Streptomyces sp. RLB3-6 TaxID=2594457 RepID=UPI0011623EE8|nr:GGDEF domain-containing protein [Streptomyces sp. RLB3-6]QDN84364.1 GGDEF domain-containing protein [Streptomyces sp. RLB3-6]